jgi:predicted RNA-binding Zn ribbon-like protein
LAVTIALTASELLALTGLERVGQCADDRGCGWLFLDNCKTRSRRGCGVQDCGNRVRPRRLQTHARLVSQ